VRSILHRHARHSLVIEIRRIVVVVAGVAVLSVVWRAVHDRVLVAVASSSVGCLGREGLIEAAMRVRNPALPTGAEFRSFRNDDSGGVIMRSLVPLSEIETAPDWPDGYYEGLLTIADAGFRIRGRLVGGVSKHRPVDVDGDGRWEVIVHVGGPTIAESDGDDYFLVLRLGERSNEIVFLARVRHSDGASYRCAWVRSEASGRLELHFIEPTRTMTPVPRSLRWPSRAVAIFAPDAAGVLRPRLMPLDDSIVVWSPADGQPPQISPLAWLGMEARRRLPPPGAPILTTPGAADPP